MGGGLCGGEHIRAWGTNFKQRSGVVKIMLSTVATC